MTRKKILRMYLRALIIKSAPAGLIVPDPEPLKREFQLPRRCGAPETHLGHKKRADGALSLLKPRAHARTPFPGGQRHCFQTNSRPRLSSPFGLTVAPFLHGCHGVKGRFTHRTHSTHSKWAVGAVALRLNATPSPEREYQLTAPVYCVRLGNVLHNAAGQPTEDSETWTRSSSRMIEWM